MVYERARGKLYEAAVSLTKRSVEAWEEKAGMQPTYMIEEVFAVSEVIMADPC